MTWNLTISNARSKASVGGAVALASLTGSFAAPLLALTPPVAWAAVLVLQIMFCVGLGVAVNGRPSGLLIDDRNRVSLARFQAMAWSILVLSALLTLAFFRVQSGEVNALAITVPKQLLAAMGMSAATYASSSALLNLKAVAPASADVVARTATRLGDGNVGVAAEGGLFVRGDPARARWLDMFRCENIVDAATPDLSKVQQFLCTVVVLVAYGASVWSAFSRISAHGVAPPSGLPELGANLLWLIGLSHAGYLVSKVAPHVSAGANVASSPPDAVG
jgi:hypothetical protein